MDGEIPAVYQRHFNMPKRFAFVALVVIGSRILLASKLQKRV